MATDFKGCDREKANDSDFFGVTQMVTLDKVLHRGLEDLLRKVIELDILDPPYGRPHLARFRFDDDDRAESSDSDKEEGSDNDDDSSMDLENPQFKYEYGFNPLVYLGTFLKKNNPTYIYRKQKQKEDGLAYLQKRAQHALKQYDVAADLQALMVRLRSGIVQGPLCGSATAESILLWAKTSKPGNLVFQVSESPEFRFITETVVVEVDHSTEMAGKVVMSHLNSNQTYYYRVCLHNPGLGFMGPDDNCFATGHFRTMPDQDEELGVSFAVFANLPASLLRLDAAHAPVQDQTCKSVQAYKPTSVLFLGDMLASECLGTMRGVLPEQQINIYRNLYNTIHRKISSHPLFREVSITNAWNDSLHKSGQRFRKEEKDNPMLKHMNTAKSMTSKKQTGKRSSKNTKNQEGLPLGPTLKVFDEQWPVALDKAQLIAHSLCKDTRMGSHIHLFSLDTRNGLLGKAQTDWLKQQVVDSHSTWKVICCGIPVAYYPIKLKETVRRRTRESGQDFHDISHQNSPDDGPAVGGILSSVTIKEVSEAEVAMEQAAMKRAEQERGTPDPNAQERERAASRIQALAKGRKTRVQVNSRNMKDASSATPVEWQQGLLHLAEHFAQRMIRNVVFLTGGAAFPYAVQFTLPDQVQKAPIYELNCSPRIPNAHIIPVPTASTELQRDDLMNLEGNTEIDYSYGQFQVFRSGSLRFDICLPDGTSVRSLNLSPDH